MNTSVEKEQLSFKKRFRKAIKKITRKEFIWKVIILISTLALIATSVLPYML